VSIVGLSGSAVLFYVLRPLSLLLSIVAVFGLATYSYVKKHFWFGGPFYNAFIVALLPLMGYFSVSATAGWTFPLFLYPYIGVTFFSYAMFVLIGYLKDIDADRATNYKTFPVVFDWEKTVLLGDLFAFVMLVFFYSKGFKNVGEIIAGVAGLVVLLAGQVVAHLSKQKNEVESLVPILNTVRSFVLFHLAIMLHFQPQWWPACIIYYLVFEVTLYLRPSKYQV